MAAGAASAVALVVVALWLGGVIGPAPTPEQVETGTLGQAANSRPGAVPEDAGKTVPDPVADDEAPQGAAKEDGPSVKAPSEKAPQTPRSDKTTGDAATTSTPDQDAPTTDMAAPRIDLFRLQSDGEALVAGQVASGWSAEIVLDGTVLATQTTGSDGKFATFVTLPEGTGPRILSLRMTHPDGRASTMGAQQIVIAPTTATAVAKAPDEQVQGARVALATRDDAPDPPVDAASSAADSADRVDGPKAAPGTPQAAALVDEGGAAPARPAPDGPSAPEISPHTPDLGTADAAAEPRDTQTTQAHDTDTAEPPETSSAEARDTDRVQAGDAKEVATMTDAPQTAPPGASGTPGALPTPATRDLPDPEQANSPEVVLMTDAEGARVLQSPSPGDAPRVISRLALDAISYSDEGDVQLAGRAAGDGFVRIYLDNSPVTTSRIARDGSWRSDLPQVDTGIYTLRIDEVTPDGDVTNRVETPFKRENRALLADLQAQSDASAPAVSSHADSGATPGNAAPTLGTNPVRAITVQPGNTLWAISRETYGEGILYVRVFEANADHIRDPDLIYPGQVFSLPQ